MLLNFTYSGGQLRAKDHLASIQYQNRKLLSFTNPFTSEERSYTRLIMNKAITFAITDADFSQNFYKPFIRARQNFTLIMKNHKFRIFYQGKLQRQGRKKLKKAQVNK